MEAKDSLVTIFTALSELGEPVPSTLLIDFLMGKETSEIEKRLWFEKESFGLGDNHEEDYWSTVIEAALNASLLKMKPAKSDNVILTPAGKKFLRKPKPFPINEDNEIPDFPQMSELDDFSQNGLDTGFPGEMTASPKTKIQINLIHAIDRKIALDDFSENEGLGFDDVLTDLENLIHQGRALDITYFTDEVMGADCVEEIISFFREKNSDDLDQAMKEYGDVYNEEEIRLARIVYRVQQMKGKA